VAWPCGPAWLPVHTADRCCLAALALALRGLARCGPWEPGGPLDDQATALVSGGEVVPFSTRPSLYWLPQPRAPTRLTSWFSLRMVVVITSPRVL
jgi:hypothetical protein